MSNGQSPPRWVMIAGCVFGAIAVLFLMALIVMSVFDYTIPRGSGYLVILLFSLVSALAFGFIGGAASAEGSIPIPVAKGNPVKFSVGGGVAVLVITAILGWYLLPTPDPQPPLIVRIDKVQVFSVEDKPQDVLVQIEYHLQGFNPPQMLVVEASWDRDFNPVSYRKNVGTPSEQQVTIQVTGRPAEARAVWVRLQAQDQSGQVLNEDVWEAAVPQP